jgi:uncharacterized membrane protein (DUF441 family)
MENSILVATILTPLISGLLQAIKHTDIVNSKWLPIVGVLVGLVVGVGYASVYKEPLPDYLLGGLLGGLGAGGFYNVVKTTKEDK